MILRLYKLTTFLTTFISLVFFTKGDKAIEIIPKKILKARVTLGTSTEMYLYQAVFQKYVFTLNNVNQNTFQLKILR